MANCLVAQSGGPTAAINASLAGVIRANQLNPFYDKVYGGINGIEGILKGELFDLTHLPFEELCLLKQTPGSALGSCRYKLKRTKTEDYERLVEIMDANNIDILFYIGGNDSMDTVDALSEWAQNNHISKRFVGIPKTIDNDLMVTDHCPGFGSGAKLVASVARATALDLGVYTRQEVYILETMGRDAGWLAGSSILSGFVDLVVLPEVDFDKEVFLTEVKRCMDATNKCYIVVSEGAHYADGTYLSAGESKNDGFGHAILGGAGAALKQMILEVGISPRVKVQDLCSLARSAHFIQSKTDIDEAFELGASAHARSCDGTFTGHVVALRRNPEISQYEACYFARPAHEFANHVKRVPLEWILPSYKGLSDEFINYVRPLIQGEPDIIYKDGLVQCIEPFNTRYNKH